MIFRLKQPISPDQLVNMNLPHAVLEEVKYNFVQSYPVEDFEIIRHVFKDFCELYDGKYPGYRACNMVYHNKYHSVDTLLVLSRIIDGYNLSKRKLPLSKVLIGLVAVLFHDSGYIQKFNDRRGTGAKYTKDHEKRSVEFIRSYFKSLGLSIKDFYIAKKMIECTDLKIPVRSIEFKNWADKKIGYMVGTADLVGQMAERSYLEKLKLLYEEFREAGIMTFESEYDMLNETIGFYKNIARSRIENDFDGTFKYLRVHFKHRYNIDKNLYIDAIERQLKYLSEILENETKKTYKNRLRRKGNNLWKK